MPITRNSLLQIAAKVALAALAITPSVGAAQLLMIPFDLLASGKTGSATAPSVDDAEITATPSVLILAPRP